tara:strand:+ start:133085 stop:133459 length:375 start_codon:yes stop_codon:yes gene_type:complete
MSFRASRTREEQRAEFMKRNQGFLTKLHEKTNDESLRCIIMSIEMLCHLYDVTDKIIGDIDGDLFSYKSDLESRAKYGIRILVDHFAVGNQINFLYRNDKNNINFDIPCMCGSFKDEPHDVRLK